MIASRTPSKHSSTSVKTPSGKSVKADIIARYRGKGDHSNTIQACNDANIPTLINSTNTDVYTRVFGGKLIDQIVLVYGASNTGKTHTIFGNKDEKGLILLFLDKLYDGHEYDVQLEVIEIYLKESTQKVIV